MSDFYENRLLLSREMVARALCVSVSTVIKFEQEGKLKPVKITKRRPLYRVSDVQKLAGVPQREKR